MDFDRDKAYTEGVFNQGPTGGPGGAQSRKTIANSSMGMIPGGTGAGTGGLAAGATGKLAAGKSKKVNQGTIEAGASIAENNKS
jgi:hypothetical protein